MSRNDVTPKGKIIRDPVHGDIFLPDFFVKLIDTPEFQRLRRIHQLAVAYMLFPGADHTRFSHSLGTFHIMQKIINHFDNHLNDLCNPIDEREKDVVLAAALLHDIGHGPFSHAFEKVFPNNVYDHESWTTKIITSEESGVNKVLKNYDEVFPDNVANLIKKQRQIENQGYDIRNIKKIDLFFIFSSLVSSQLDADRMDYLLRDAMYTGVKHGEVDISRLINAMRVTEYKNNFYVCILEKYMDDVEKYLLSRYQMHKGVYYHNFKCEMEIIIKKILNRAMELFKLGVLKESDLPDGILSIFTGNEMTVKQFNSLDDSILLALFNKWTNISDDILSCLCNALINRKKYRKLRILNNKTEEIDQFKSDLTKIFKRYNYEIKNFEKEYFWIESSEKIDIYKSNKENIWILRRNGVISDLTDISKVISKKQEMHRSKDSNVDNTLKVNITCKKEPSTNLMDYINVGFINFELIKTINNIDNKEDIVEDIEKLIDAYDSRNHIEIEKKYYFDNKDVFNKVLRKLNSLDKYNLSNGCEKQQIDYYYDTLDNKLLHLNSTLRIRKKGNDYQLTIKKPTNTTGSNEQSERFEYEIPIIDKNIKNNHDYVNKYFPEIIDELNCNNIYEYLTITNNRTKHVLTKENIIFEVVFDDVKYSNNMTGKSSSEYQVEIELKSDYPHRVNLKLLTDYLENEVVELKATSDSKYKRGLALTK